MGRWRGRMPVVRPGYGSLGWTEGCTSSRAAAMTPAADGMLTGEAPLALADTFQFERSLQARGYSLVAGLDEAGRGPLAGPVVAACVILPHDCPYHLFKDSKLLTASRREELFAHLHTLNTIIGVGSADPREIEQLNILHASLLAMHRALDNCTARNGNLPPGHLLVDGKFPVPTPIAQTTLIKGERRSATIAAASIIAKVTRDRVMAEYHRLYPQYEFQRHQGYPTKAHRQAIERYGPSPIHRRTFRGVREFLLDEVPILSQGTLDIGRGLGMVP